MKRGMITDVHVDVETFSEVELRFSGVYPYTRHPSFEVMLLAFREREDQEAGQTTCLDMTNGKVYVTDPVTGDPVEKEGVTYGEELRRFKGYYLDERVTLRAHNAMFERNALRGLFGEIPLERWKCNMIHAAYAGLPLQLGELGDTLGVDKRKLAQGTNLVRLFCSPCKPTATNGYVTRESVKTRPGKWMEFIKYNIRDVDTEMEISRMLDGVTVPPAEWNNYYLDQAINDRGVLADRAFVNAAITVRDGITRGIVAQMKRKTGLPNPVSPVQLKAWVLDQTGQDHPSFNKEVIEEVMRQLEPFPKVREVMNLRNQAASTSVKKYDAFLTCMDDGDDRVRGVYQHYGANRTGRSSGRLVQPQNLPRNNMPDLLEAREMVMTGDPDLLMMYYDDPVDVLSQLIRTALVAPGGKLLGVLDYSSIEARVIALLAGETWRLEVFRSHGKIYETSASRMFRVPLEECGKGTEYREKGKVAELACGFQGGWRAMDKMQRGAGIPLDELKRIVKEWRAASPNIVKLWYEYEELAVRTILTGRPQKARAFGVEFAVEGDWMTIRLPSRRKLYFYKPQVKMVERFGRSRYQVTYIDKVQGTVGTHRVPTYAGHLVQGVVQATARDLLFRGMQRATRAGYDVVMHTHDEVIFELNEDTAERDMERLTRILSAVPEWFQGVPLPAEGFLTKYYRKDD